MSNLLIVREERKYLTSSLLDHIKEYNHRVIECAPDVKQINEITYELDACLLFVEGAIADNHQALVYLRDLAVEKGFPIFLLGYPIDIEGIRGIIGNSAIQEEILRPFDVKDISAHLDEFLKNRSLGIKKKILVVDDSGVMLRNIKNLLGDKYQVALANSGAMAVKYLTLDKPDLVLLDYEMPIINGKQVLEIIKSEKDFEGIPVIFLTGKNDRETIMDVMALKPEGYLLKSMTAEAFLNAIDEFFEKRKRIN